MLLFYFSGDRVLVSEDEVDLWSERKRVRKEVRCRWWKSRSARTFEVDPQRSGPEERSTASQLALPVLRDGYQNVPNMMV